LTGHIAVFTSRHDGRPIHLAREHRTKRPRKRNAHPAPNRPKTRIVATRHVINTHRTRATHRTAALIFPSASIHATVRSHVSYRSFKVLRVSYRFAQARFPVEVVRKLLRPFVRIHRFQARFTVVVYFTTFTVIIVVRRFIVDVSVE